MAKYPILRTKSATTKVTEVEYSLLEELARAGNLNLSEWMRGKLLGSNRTGSNTNVLLGELLALRTILLNLLFSLSRGESLTGEQVQVLIDRADKDKLRRAQERLSSISVPVTDRSTGEQ